MKNILSRATFFSVSIFLLVQADPSVAADPAGDVNGQLRLRNLAVQAAFFHNGAFTRLSDALRYHLKTTQLAQSYDPVEAGVARDLIRNTGPIAPVLERIDPALSQPVSLSEAEFGSLLAFLRDGLTDERARPENLVHAIPTSVPSGLSLHVFETTPSVP
jgi:cytochrome c peroxidase